MPTIIETPTYLQASGNKLKVIKEYIGNLNTNQSELSIAMMESPQGWQEPGQKPDYDEYTLVLNGTLQVETKEEVMFVKKGQVVIVHKGEWIRYSTPLEEAQYLSICLPAFSKELMNRDEE